MARTFRLTGTVSLDFRSEFFNLFNDAHFLFPEHRREYAELGHDFGNIEFGAADSVRIEAIILTHQPYSH